MDSEEREIYNFLKYRPGEFTSSREIARRVKPKRFLRGNQEWAAPILTRMVERGILEKEGELGYRLKPPKQNDRMQRWIAPGIADALKRNGGKFGDIAMSGGDLDDYYESL